MNLNKIMAVMSMLGGFLMCHAAHKTVRSEDGFQALLKKQPFAVVFFYNQSRQLVVCSKKASKTHANKEAMCHKLVRKNDHAQRTLSSARKNKQYRNADLMFIKVNVGRSDLDMVAREYGIKQFPSFVLFKYGVPVSSKDGHVALLSGSISPMELREFIKRHLGHELDAHVEQKKDDYYQQLDDQTWDNIFYGYPSSNFNASYDEVNTPGVVGFGFTIP